MNVPNHEKSVGEHVLQALQITASILEIIIYILLSIIVALVKLFIPKSPKSIRGEVALITGAGHGMGKELALLYAEAGATVVAWDINKEANENTVKEIEKLGYTKAHAFVCDVSNRQNVLEVAKQVQQKLGNVTILINNAGIMPTHPLYDHTAVEIERIMNINVMAHFWTLEAFLPSMRQNNYGHIVCMSSTAGLCGVNNLVPYCTSKYAVRGLMEALHEELRLLGKTGVKTTTIYPYMVDTGLCKRPKIKFEKVMPLVKAKDAAKAIINAQRTDIIELSVPSFYLPVLLIERLLPRSAIEKTKDYVDVGLESDL